MLVTSMSIHMNNCVHRDCMDMSYKNFVKKDEWEIQHNILSISNCIYMTIMCLILQFFVADHDWNYTATEAGAVVVWQCSSLWALVSCHCCYFCCTVNAIMENNKNHSIIIFQGLSNRCTTLIQIVYVFNCINIQYIFHNFCTVVLSPDDGL